MKSPKKKGGACAPPVVTYNICSSVQYPMVNYFSVAGMPSFIQTGIGSPFK